MKFPDDADILFSFVNTKLRDEYSDVERLCDDYDENSDRLFKKLEKAGYYYDKAMNKFCTK